jgi:hypothetical protein
MENTKEVAEAIINQLRKKFTDDEISEAVINMLREMQEKD